MLALNRSRFSGWMIAKELGAIPNDQTSASQNAQTPEEVQAAKPSAPWQREPMIDFNGLLQPHPLALWAVFGLLRGQL